MSKKKSNINDDERDTFRQHVSSMKNVTKPNTPPHNKDSDEDYPPTTFTFGSSDINQAGPNDQLSFFRSGVSEQIKRKMKRGTVSIESRLDLHGKTIDETTQALSRFIAQHYEHKHRWLLIIHGKGSKSAEQRPIIKNLTAKLLEAHPAVLAFHSTIPKHGGTGAVYVLLKSNKQ